MLAGKVASKPAPWVFLPKGSPGEIGCRNKRRFTRCRLQCLIEYFPAFVRDPDANALNGAAAPFDSCRRCCREPVANKVKQFDREPRKEQRISPAAGL